MFRVILFDLDGTLLDPCEGITGSVAYALQKKGYPVPDMEVLKTFIGPPLTDQFMAYCGIDREAGREMVETYREYYRPIGMLQNERYPGVEEMLQRLKESGLVLAVASSKPEPFVKKILAHFGMDGYFDFIGGSSLDGTRENKAAVIGYVLENMGISPSRNVAMVGDRMHDVQGAQVFGLFSLAVTWGHGSREELENAKADVLCDTPAEAAAVLLQ